MAAPKKVKISEIKLNPNNPRLIKDDKFQKLVKSIKEFPEMLDIRPIVVNADMIILGGNMRFKACKDAGLKEIPVIIADNLTDEQQREFLIKDNTSGGEWDFEMLHNEWDVEQLEEWGLDVPELKEKEAEGDILFSNELDQESNYIILKFNTDIDWLQVQTIFDLKSTYSKRANGKPWSKGIGRVLDGVDAIIKIKES
jgi:ParB-like chromosome segregation protein Spo0J